jgi:hypothetical protein
LSAHFHTPRNPYMCVPYLVNAMPSCSFLFRDTGTTEWKGFAHENGPVASSSAVGNYFMLAAKNKARDISSDFAFKLAASRLSATLRKGWQGIGSRWTDMAQLSPACFRPFSFCCSPADGTVGAHRGISHPKMEQQREFSRAMWSGYLSHFKS